MSSPLQLLRLIPPQKETKAWFKRNASLLPKLSNENRVFIKDITGHVPLLIQPLLKMESFDETTFLQSKQLTLMQRNITSFYNNLLDKKSTVSRN